VTPKYSVVETFPPYSPVTGVILIDAKPPNYFTNHFLFWGVVSVSKNVLSEGNHSFTTTLTFSSIVSQS